MVTNSPPMGFDLLAAALVVYILAGLAFIGSAPVGAEMGWLGVLLATSVVLAGVVIEALWKVRPWITRASIALAVTLLAEVAAIPTGLDARGEIRLLLGTAGALVVMVAYVHDRAGRILAAGPSGRP